MFTNTLLQTNKLLDTMWENWETGVHKVYDSQMQFGKIQLEAFKKQQELFTSMTSNLNQAEEEIKSSLNNLTQQFKENSKFVNNEEAARLLETWNEKMAGIIDRIQQLSSTPSRAMLAMVEQSQERIYETVKKASEEQVKMQSETKELIENFMTQAKESQSKLVEIIDGQTKQAFENLQPK